ncbi:MAG TPA: flagellar export chaperone FliS [Bryobacteraceae bacterium]|jgi:flagellar protein FliS|nr:flagellar export chaperone FliS [Bryobacteraceae bacterium]
MTPSDIRKEYISSRVSAATPMELTRMLYEGAIQSVQEAVAAHRLGDLIARGNAVTKAVEILGELRFSLRREVNPQYCDTLAGLYGYLQRRLIQAHAEKSESMLREVQALIQTLLDGWVGAIDNVEGKQGGEPEKAAEGAGSNSSTVNASNPYSPEPETSQNRSWQF